MLFRFVVQCVVLVVLIAVGPSVAAEKSASPPADSRAQRVDFVTDDNIAITAAFTPAKLKGDEKAPVAILLHMYRSDRSAYDPLVPNLHRAGVAVLAIDLRGHGESAGAAQLGLAERVANRDKKLFAQMYKDVEAGYRWLADRPDVDLSRLVLVGASVGCSIALDYAARDRSVDGLVLLTPGTSYMGLDSLGPAQKYGRRPMLLIASEAERSACDQLAKLAPNAVLKIVHGGGADGQALHGTRMLGKVPDVEKAITDFVVKSAGPPSREVVVASAKGEVYYTSDSSNAKNLSKANLRWFSSPDEAEERGLRPPKARSTKSKSNQKTSDSGGEAFPDNPKP